MSASQAPSDVEDAMTVDEINRAADDFELFEALLLSQKRIDFIMQGLLDLITKHGTPELKRGLDLLWKRQKDETQQADFKQTDLKQTGVKQADLNKDHL